MHNTQDIIEMPSVTIEDLLHNGIQYGHSIRARNPRMLPFIYGEAGGIHIIDVRQTLIHLKVAMKALYDVATSGGRILFVTTNNKFVELIEKMAADCGQHSTRHWRGGTLTNWKMTTSGVHTLRKLNEFLAKCESVGTEESSEFTKKEISGARSKQRKLNECFRGRELMAGMPDLIVLCGGIKGENLIIQETRCIGTPVIGVVDTDCDPTLIEYPVPGNDNSIRAVKFYCDLFTKAVLSGTKKWFESQAAIAAKKASFGNAESDLRSAIHSKSVDTESVAITEPIKEEGKD